LIPLLCPKVGCFEFCPANWLGKIQNGSNFRASQRNQNIISQVKGFCQFNHLTLVQIFSKKNTQNSLELILLMKKILNFHFIGKKIKELDWLAITEVSKN